MNVLHLAAILASSLISAGLLLTAYRFTTPQSRLAQHSEKLRAVRRMISQNSDDPSAILALEKDALLTGVRLLVMAFPGALATLVLVIILLFVIDPWVAVYPLGDAAIAGWRPRWYWIFLGLTFLWGLPLKKIMRIH